MRPASQQDGAGRAAVLLYLTVALGSALGGTVRWLISTGMQGWAGSGFPWGTMFVNLTGSLLIGWYAALAVPEGRLRAGPHQRHFVMSGFCGGYTTFSIFSLEVFELLQAGQSGIASFTVGAALLTWLIAVWAGFALGTRMNRLHRSQA